MKNLMNKFFAAAALFACFACSKTEIDINNVVNNDERGVYVYLPQIVEDDAPATRGYSSSNWAYNMEVNDRISIWSQAGTLQIFKVVETTTGPNGNFIAKIEASGFTLTDGEEYYCSYPFVLENVVNDHTAQVLTYEGQTQTDQNGTKLRDLAKYDYSWAKAVSDGGNANFSFTRFSTFFKVVATLPQDGMTIKEVKVTADRPLFALNGIANMTNGTFTPTGDLSESITMTLNNVTVSGNVLTAYFASAPLEEANYVITITDSANNVYTSESLHRGVRAAGKSTTFTVTVAPEGGYVKLNAMPSVLDGKYLLVYPVNGKYRAFSFAKTMENAETAAASVATTAFADLYDQSSTLYNTVIGGNYVELTDEDGDGILMLTDEQEAELALNMAANSSPWTVTENAKDLQTTLTSGSYSLGVDHLVANIASNGEADLVAAFNAPNAVAIMNDLRGHDVSVTFEDLKNLALAKVDGFDATPGSLDDEFLTKAFNKLVAVAQEVVSENPHNLFPAGSTLNITLSSNAFDVFKQYHDNAAEISWRISPEKRFGLAQLGYNVNAQGFTIQVDLPSYEWFTRLEQSLVSSNNSREQFIANWKAFDSQYTVKIDGVKVDNFFEKLATKFVAKLNTSPISILDEFFQLYSAAQMGKFTAIGNAYKTLAEKLNTGIQPAYIYKKVVE